MDLNTPIDELLSEESELYHGKLMKRVSKSLKKKFKYVAKVDVGKTTRYFYSLAEYKAFLDGKDKSKEDDVKTTKTPATPTSKKPSNIPKSSDKRSDFGTLIKSGQNFIERQLKKAAKETSKKIESEVKEKTESLKKVAKETEKVLKKVEKQVPKKVIVAKKETEEAFEKIKKELKKVEKPVSKKIEAAKKETEEALANIKKELKKVEKSTSEKTDLILKKVARKADVTGIQKKAENDATAKADAISKANSPKSWDELEHKDREYTRDEDQAAINPNYVTNEEGSKVTEEEKAEIISLQEETGVAIFEYQINCQSCTLAYDLRRRGYDVEAAPYDWDETWQANYEGISSWYKGVTVDDWTVHTPTPMPDGLERYEDGYGEAMESRQKELRAKIASTFDDMPDGSYGQFCVYSYYGGGHSIVWEKENGKVTLRDCQINETYSLDHLATDPDEYYSCLREVSILRTDDKELTDEALKRVRNVSDTSPIEEALKKIRERIEKDEKDERRKRAKHIEENRRNRARKVLERKTLTT